MLETILWILGTIGGFFVLFKVQYLYTRHVRGFPAALEWDTYEWRVTSRFWKHKE